MKPHVFTSIVGLVLALSFADAAQIGASRAVTAQPAALVNETASGGSSMPVVSADGSHVAFVSRSQNLVTNPVSGSYQIFLRDLADSNTVLVSTTPANTGGNGHATLPSLSSNGLWIAFESEASDLVADDTNGVADIFVRDVANEQTLLVTNRLLLLATNVHRAVATVGAGWQKVGRATAGSMASTPTGSSSTFRPWPVTAPAISTTIPKPTLRNTSPEPTRSMKLLICASLPLPHASFPAPCKTPN